MLALPHNWKPNWESSLRIAADIGMVNLSLLLGLSFRFLIIILGDSNTGIAEHHYILNHYREVFLNSSWLITLVCLITFSLSGFYTHGRSYRSRYKALIIFQAVSLGYLVSGFLLYVLMGKGVQQSFGFTGPEIPRSAFFISWVMTYILVAGSRLWSTLWRKVVYLESRNLAIHKNRDTKSVLVIGGAGYIGSALLRRLLEKGYRVRLLDMLLYGPGPIADILDHPKLEVIQSDFRQIDKAVEGMQDMDKVVHLGAIVGDPACALDEKLTIDVNMIAARMIAEIAKSTGVERFIFASTCSVYGIGEEALNEHSQLNPVSLYARSKLAAEQMLLRMGATNFNPVILRFGTIYGLSGRIRFDLVVNLLTAKALVEGQITVFGGSQWRPFVHVDDAAHAILLSLEAPLSAVRGEVFNVGSNEQNYQIQDVGKIIHQMVPSAELINKGEDSDPRDYRVNFDKIRNMLNFVPEWTVEDGIKQVIQAIQDGKVENYMDNIYSNVKFMTDEGGSRLMFDSQEWMSSNLSEAVGENHE
jgi:nucleoside-diphosphate-sugar epimerase